MHIMNLLTYITMTNKELAHYYNEKIETLRLENERLLSLVERLTNKVEVEDYELINTNNN